jgi:hypothetical protein
MECTRSKNQQMQNGPTLCVTPFSWSLNCKIRPTVFKTLFKLLSEVVVLSSLFAISWLGDRLGTPGAVGFLYSNASIF